MTGTPVPAGRPAAVRAHSAHHQNAFVDGWNTAVTQELHRGYTPNHYILLSTTLRPAPPVLREALSNFIRSVKAMPEAQTSESLGYGYTRKSQVTARFVPILHIKARMLSDG